MPCALMCIMNYELIMNYYYYYLYMRAMGRHGFPGIPRRHAAAFSCNGSARGICADAYI